MRFQTLCMAIALSVPLLSLSGPAGAQSNSELSNRLNRLENELQTMNRAVYKGETPPPSVSSGSGSGSEAAESLVRVQELESQIQTLTGKIEEQGFEIIQLKGQIDRMKVDYDMRLQDLEAGKTGGSLNGTPGAAPMNSGATTPTYQAPSSVSGGIDSAAGSASEDGYEFSTNNTVAATDSADASTDTLPFPKAGEPPSVLGTITQDSAGQPTGTAGDSVAEAYENAFSLLKAGNYEAAGREFDAFLQKNPDHVLSGNAKYWLGETYYVRGDYEKASRVFAEAYQKYPDGAKAADNLLKLGLSLAATGNNKDACVALRQLEKDYQSGSGPVLRRAQQEMSKLGC